MSYEYDSTSAAGHFTGKDTWRNGLKNQLDGYLMMHANRSLSLVRHPSAENTLALVEWSEQFKGPSMPVHITRTHVVFASGELSTDENSVTLRATNVLNSHDTIHRVSTSEHTMPSGIILPAVTVQRIALPKQASDISLADMHNGDYEPISDQTAYNPELALSVLRASSLLCRFATRA